jgi:enoyl-CoA hydratase/carnithine racemase
MGPFTSLLYDERDGVATVTMNRPEALNAFDETMMRELQTCWRQLRGNDDVRAVVLTGAGDRAWSTGLDRMDTAPGDLREDTLIGNKGSVPLYFDDPGELVSPKSACDLWKPIVAAVNGIACAGAFYILAETDIVIASEQATFFDPHVTYGMAAVFEPMMMLQRMPLGETLRMALLGAHERMSAQRAHQIGMVQDVVPAGDLLAAAQEVATIIASQPALAVQGTVRAVWYAQDLGYRQALDVAKTFVQLATSDESLLEGQRVFTSGTRVPWRLR